MADYLLNFR